MCPHGALSFTAAGAPSTCSLARSLGTCSASPELHLLRGDDRSIRVIQLRLQLLQVCPCSANMSHHRRAPDPETKEKKTSGPSGGLPGKARKPTPSDHPNTCPFYHPLTLVQRVMSSCPHVPKVDDRMKKALHRRGGHGRPVQWILVARLVAGLVSPPDEELRFPSPVGLTSSSRARHLVKFTEHWSTGALACSPIQQVQ